MNGPAAASRLRCSRVDLEYQVRNQWLIDSISVLKSTDSRGTVPPSTAWPETQCDLPAETDGNCFLKTTCAANDR
jgi:hypothetical protein